MRTYNGGWEGLNREGSELGGYESWGLSWEGMSCGVWVGRIWVVGSELEGYELGGYELGCLSLEGLRWRVIHKLHEDKHQLVLTFALHYRLFNQEARYKQDGPYIFRCTLRSHSAADSGHKQKNNSHISVVTKITGKRERFKHKRELWYDSRVIPVLTKEMLE